MKGEAPVEGWAPVIEAGYAEGGRCVFLTRRPSTSPPWRRLLPPPPPAIRGLRRGWCHHQSERQHDQRRLWPPRRAPEPL